MEELENQSIDDPDVVLAFLTGAGRPDDDEPGLDLMLADRSGLALKVVIVVDDVPAAPSDAERTGIAQGLTRAAAHNDAVGGLVLAVRRAGAPAPDDHDRAWHDAFDTACRFRGVKNLGVYIATRKGACRVLPVSGS